jgi:hypothetical protein
LTERLGFGVTLEFRRSFLYVSSFGRTAATGTNVFSKLCEYSNPSCVSLPASLCLPFLLTISLLCRTYIGQEYARADVRWGHADPTVVSLELLTVFGAGPMCVYILYLLIRNDQSRHYWIVILSVAELYGGYECGLSPSGREQMLIAVCISRA